MNKKLFILISSLAVIFLIVVIIIGRGSAPDSHTSNIEETEKKSVVPVKIEDNTISENQELAQEEEKGEPDDIAIATFMTGDEIEYPDSPFSEQDVLDLWEQFSTHQATVEKVGSIDDIEKIERRGDDKFSIQTWNKQLQIRFEQSDEPTIDRWEIGHTSNHEWGIFDFATKALILRSAGWDHEYRDVIE